MVLNIKPLTEAEILYVYTNSKQISSQTGLIGYLRADMDRDGNGFFSSWCDYANHLKTDEFREEFDNVINSLSKTGNILQNRTVLANYCSSNPDSKISDDYYGVRVDTEKYAYLLRLNPNEGEYNLYCYCYRKDWLDDHLRSSEKGIRFIDTGYNESFRIKDGSSVIVEYPDGTKKSVKCRYIDNYHLEFNDIIFHICELAEKMQDNGNKLIPDTDSLISKPTRTKRNT